MSVLISIKPEWCEKIANGKKTIEVRKSAPKEVPFKAYIYCTRITDKKHCSDEVDVGMWKGNEHVIGEFICDRIDEYKYVYCDHPEIGYPVGYDCGDNWYDIDDEDLQKACLTEEEFKRYGNCKPLYGWHISDLKIYDKPKELSEFHKPCKEQYYCEACKHGSIIIPPDEEEYALYHGGSYERYETVCHNVVTRPPQSYMYVDEVEE